MKAIILLLLVGCAAEPVAELSSSDVTMLGVTGPEISPHSPEATEAMAELEPTTSATTCVRDRDGAVACCEISPTGSSACCCRTGPNPTCSCGPIVISPHNPPSAP